VPSRTEGFIWAGDEAGVAPLLGNGSVLAEAVASLVGAGPVRLFKEKLNYKLSGGGGYRAHQDGYTQIGTGDGDSPAYSFMAQVGRGHIHRIE
jgi:hypothetical protein